MCAMHFVNAETSLKNLDDYFAGAPLENEICYRCLGTGGAAKSNCPRRANGRCLARLSHPHRRRSRTRDAECDSKNYVPPLDKS